MAKSSATRAATVADVQRLLAKTTISGTTKKRGKTKRVNGSTGANPVALGSTLTVRGPTAGASTAGNSRIRNVEYVADITATSSPIIGFDLNPISSALFTWLGRVAGGYELFRFHKLRLVYTPICPSTTQGVVVLAFDYDASDAPPTTKQAITGYSGSARTNVWNRLTCDLKPPAGWFYVGSSPTTVNPANTDIKFYDVAKAYIGIFNATPGTTVGELTIEYDVEFSKPDFSPYIVNELINNFSNSTLSNIPGTYSITGSDIFSLSSTGSGKLQMTFKLPGKYLMEVCGFATASAVVGNPFNDAVYQTDPGTTGANIGWSENVTTAWTNSSTNLTFVNLLAVTVSAGTTLLLTATSIINTMSLFRLRVAPYYLT